MFIAHALATMSKGETMMSQQEILDVYVTMFNKPTLKKTSELTGIQITRVFRIMNGSVMSITEYQAFYNLINAKKENSSLRALIEKGLMLLSGDKLQQIESELVKGLAIKEFVCC